LLKVDRHCCSIAVEYENSLVGRICKAKHHPDEKKKKEKKEIRKKYHQFLLPGDADLDQIPSNIPGSKVVEIVAVDICVSLSKVWLQHNQTSKRQQKIP